MRKLKYRVFIFHLLQHSTILPYLASQIILSIL